MSRLRREVLEDWETFLNPYQNLRASIDDMRNQLDGLGINDDRDRFADPEVASDFNKLAATIKRLSQNYTRAYGLATSLRVLAPILAEAFVNLLMFVLLKSDIKANERLREAAIRAQIDIKVQSLHINCDGFQNKVDWSAPACRAYNTVVNERNDTLHGNIVVSKLKTGEMFFNGKVPVFKKYAGFWGKTFATSLQACGYAELPATLQAIDDFIAYVLSCLKPDVRQAIEFMMGRKELGRNLRTGRVGVLLPELRRGYTARPHRGEMRCLRDMDHRMHRSRDQVLENGTVIRRGPLTRGVLPIDRKETDAGRAFGRR